ASAASAFAGIAVLLLRLHLALEGVEAIVPELIEELAQLEQPFRAGSVDASRAVAALSHETCVVQDPQVLRDRLPCDIEVRGDPPRGHLMVADEMQDLTAPRLGDGIDGCLHCIRQYTLSQFDTCASLCLQLAPSAPIERSRDES